ncbi:hypothetical protein MAR_010607 [Mya arenaria]|uniref:DNA-directed DNA polymerase n=1 Tax=Mya arenaria TaxID=6604 RepID=A0ABY7E4B9_MYAAR|nr:hypothetical protein MAR_010607 [Mya arenaria]
MHKVLQFDARAWFKEYIDFNTQKRTYAKNAFEKDFLKLTNNSVFGKTIENLRKRDSHADKHLFDNSDYPSDDKFHNKKVIGKVKDEATSFCNLF